MSKKFLFLTSLVLAISLASISYGADPCMIKLDFNNDANNNDANTQVSFTKFIIADSGSEVSSGIYFYRLTSPHSFHTGRMSLLR